MPVYQYSRRDALARSYALCSSRLEGLLDEARALPDPGLCEELVYQGYLLASFPRELNEKAAAVIRGLLGNSGPDKDVCLDEAARFFKEAGYDVGMTAAPHGAADTHGSLAGISTSSLAGPEYKFETVSAKELSADRELDVMRALQTAFIMYMEGAHEGTQAGLLELLVGRFTNRFEVTGRIFSNYGPGITGGHGTYSRPGLYILLSAVLLAHYRSTGSLKTLNAMLKLNDLIVFLLDEGFECRPTCLVLHCLAGEQEEVEMLYGSRGFRLPADR